MITDKLTVTEWRVLRTRYGLDHLEPQKDFVDTAKFLAWGVKGTENLLNSACAKMRYEFGENWEKLLVHVGVWQKAHKDVPDNLSLAVASWLIDQIHDETITKGTDFGFPVVADMAGKAARLVETWASAYRPLRLP